MRIQPSSHQVIESWSSAAEAAACKCAAAGLSPALTACQIKDSYDYRHAIAWLRKKITLGIKPSFYFFYAESDRHSLKPCLRGEVDPGRPYPLIIPLS